jgi:hypothetical protein
MSTEIRIFVLSLGNMKLVGGPLTRAFRHYTFYATRYMYHFIHSELAFVPQLYTSQVTQASTWPVFHLGTL